MIFQFNQHVLISFRAGTWLRWMVGPFLTGTHWPRLKGTWLVTGGPDAGTHSLLQAPWSPSLWLGL